MKLNNLSVIIYIIVFISGHITAFPNMVLATENPSLVNESNELKFISNEPLFTLDNMAPGIEKSSTITVENNGDEDFILEVTADKYSGDEILYNHLEVQIGDEKTELYSGEMNDIDNIKLKEIEVNNKEKIKFQIYFPPGKGNELQGKSFSADWIFTAKWEDDTDTVTSPPVTDPEDDDDDDPDESEEDPEDSEEPEESDDPERQDIEEDPEDPGIDPDDKKDPADEREIDEDENDREDDPDIPATGEFPPYLFYGAGGLLVFIGCVIGIKVRNK